MKDVIVGWFKNLFAFARPEEIGQGAQTFERKAKAKLIDVTDGVSLTEEARRRSTELLSMIRRGGTQIDRLRLWLTARRKIKNSVADFYDIPDIMDEVTEKILDAAQKDSRLRKMFG
jgi:secreted Zn-dependent insulinase-like peptidase